MTQAARPVAEPRRQVLLVEDHQDTRAMYAEFLGDIYDIVEAADGTSALARMRADLPDVVITDLALPGLDGFELIARIRSDASLASVAIICLSGYSGETHFARAHAAGCDRVLRKPCMPDELATAIAEVLDAKAGRRS